MWIGQAPSRGQLSPPSFDCTHYTLKSHALHKITDVLPTMAAATKNEANLLMAREASNVPWCEPFERMISGMAYG